MSKNITTPEEGVKCELDGVYVHQIARHLADNHPHISVTEYREKYPDAPLESRKFTAAREAAAAKKAAEGIVAEHATVATLRPGARIHGKKKFADVFGLGAVKAAKNSRGEDIMIATIDAVEPEWADFIPPIDKNYIFDVDTLKGLMVGVSLNLPVLLWGYHGTGKTTLIEQYCARTGRPWYRVQHTVSTEEAHILGHYVVKGGATVFEPGPLAVAMRNGLTYVADEYDFALPSVTSVYQSVLEGKPLFIKEAPPEWRVVKPHPDFRFVATGNTNGAGDETGLYQGTQIMNAANYSRFAITLQIGYMNERQEAAVVASQTKILPADAAKLVEVAKEIREQFMKGTLSQTISPRELINAAKLGKAFGVEPDLRLGLQLAYTNRLSSTDRKAVDGFVQRVFG